MALKPKLNDQTVYLIDGSGYIFRAYYAIRSLRSKSGIPTNAVYGFTTMLLKLLKEHNPHYIAIAFDRKEPTFRHHFYPEYKANRQAPPEDLIPQFPLIHQVVEACNIKILAKAGFEADDLIATMAKKAKEQGREVIIVTGDKDLMQLVDDETFVMDELRALKVGLEQYADAMEVKKELGVWPNQIVDMLALCGDASDNVPGVQGIGKKTAVELLEEHGTLERIFSNVQGIKQNSRKEKLVAGQDLALLSKKLVTLDDDVSIELSLEDLKWSGLDHEKSQALFMQLDFNRLLKDEGKIAHKEPLVSPKTLSEAKKESLVVGSMPAFLSMIERLTKESKVGVHVETAPKLNPLQSPLLGIAFALSPSDSFYLPLGHSRHEASEQLKLAEVLAPINDLLASQNIIWVAHNAKAHEKILRRHGFLSANFRGDPMLASYLLRSDQAKHGLKELSDEYLPDLPSLDDESSKKNTNMDLFSEMPFPKISEQAGEKAKRSLAIEEILLKELREHALDDLYYSLELPLEKVLGTMELHGVKIDTGVLGTLEKELASRMSDLEKEAYEIAGEKFNLASPKQVAALLFDKLGLPTPKKTKTGFSTDAAVLEKIKNQHALPRILLEHRLCAKLINTYLSVLPTLIDPKTRRVHTTYNQFIAATGRLSSSDPNLQNIPIRTKEGRLIRRAFVANDDCSLISLDYSQVELRLLAFASGDPVLLDSFHKDEDVHKRTASEIFDVALSDVTSEQRNAAKTINFGLLYGMGPKRLSDTLGISFSEANKYLTKYFEKYSGILSWKTRVLLEAKKSQTVRTLFGRRRSVPELASQNAVIRNRGERLAINTPIQGTAADIIKKAMLDTDDFLTKHFPNARMIMQVHDELVIEAPKHDASAIAKKVADIMSRGHGLDVFLKVEYGIADNWDDAH